MSDLTSPVVKQLEAYNNRDVETFMTCFAKECVVEDGTGKLLMENWDVMKERYTTMFEKSPDLHCNVVSRIVLDRYVIDEENVTGRRGEAGIYHVVAVYRVEDGLIRHVRFLK